MFGISFGIPDRQYLTDLQLPYESSLTPKPDLGHDTSSVNAPLAHDILPRDVQTCYAPPGYRRPGERKGRKRKLNNNRPDEFDNSDIVLKIIVYKV